MRFILFYTFYSIIWLITRLPLSLLYGFSSLCFPLVYYLIPYRKDVVFNNLRNSFPAWDENRVRQTAKSFYRHFCDSMIESTALNFLNEKEPLKRLRYKNPELVNELYNKGKSIVLLMAHYGNWELTNTCPRFVKHEVVAIYKPLSNKYFNKFFIRARERFGVKTIAMEKIVRYLSEASKQDRRTMTYFLADQRPHWSKIQYWTKFLNQDTPVILGPEKIARKFNMAVVYLKITRLSRGQYEAEFILLKEDSRATRDFEITDLYFKNLENTIIEAPEYWLWTHKRWKYASRGSVGIASARLGQVQ